MPALVAGIHVFAASPCNEDVDGRDKPGHDDCLRSTSACERINSYIVSSYPELEEPRARDSTGSDRKIRGCLQSPQRRTARRFACCNCKQMNRCPCSCPRTTDLGRLRSDGRRTQWPLRPSLR